MPTNVNAPNIEALHRDIGLANQFRLEFVKTVLAITTALFAFTVSFRPRLTEVHHENAMLMGWIGLSVALFGGLGNMYGWERFYMSYRDYEWHQHDGKPKRKVITFWRRVAFAAQVLGFIIGVAGIAWFAATNLPYAKAGGT